MRRKIAEQLKGMGLPVDKFLNTEAPRPEDNIKLTKEDVGKSLKQLSEIKDLVDSTPPIAMVGIIYFMSKGYSLQDAYNRTVAGMAASASQDIKDLIDKLKREGDSR